MPLVCLELPEVELAGRSVRLAISAEAGMLWGFLGGSPGAPNIDSAAAAMAGSLLCRNPHVLLWLLARYSPTPERFATIESLLGVVAEGPPVPDSPAPVDGVPPGTRSLSHSETIARCVSSKHRRKYIRRLTQVGALSGGGGRELRRGVSRLEEILGRMVARAGGGSAKQGQRWLASFDLTGKFWRELGRSGRESGPWRMPWPSPGTDGPPVGETELARRVQQASLEGLKHLAYGASHEINNPLANIASRAQTLLLDETDRERRLKLAKINEQAFRAHEMIADMMLFAHPPSPEFRQADPAVIVRQVIEELMSAGEFQSANLDVDVPESLPPIWVDPDQLAVALRAVVQNSVEATGSGGQIAIRAVADAGPWATEISVSDNGPGFPPDQLEHVFDPFYSGREAGRGLGFGLSKAWRIAQLHDGEIEAANAGHRGAIVTIRLPRPSTAA